MKKVIMLFLLSAAMSGVPKICQADPIEVEVGLQIFDPIGTYPFPRGPVGLPNVYIDANTLSFENLWGTYVLQILQGSTVVYTTVVPYGTTSVVLPSTLSGNYEFRLVADSYYYYGYITL
jgi:hypothetical protein